MEINTYTSKGKNIINIYINEDELYTMKRNYPNTFAGIDSHLKQNRITREDLIILLESL
jgi:hypothetical protein